MYILDYMSKTDTVQIRISSTLKKKASTTLGELGMDFSSGITLFLTQLVREQALPFRPMKDPKKLRAKWDREVTEALKNGKRFKDAESLTRSLLE